MLSRLPITSTTFFPPLFLFKQSGELSRKTIFALLLNRKKKDGGSKFQHAISTQIESPGLVYFSHNLSKEI